MAKQNSKDAKSISEVRYANGRWITSDGLCFNTRDKAETHVAKQKNEPLKSE